MVYVVADDLRYQPMVNFADDYRRLNGRKISDEIVNMILRQVSATLHNTEGMVMNTDAFSIVYKTIQRQGSFGQIEAWRLANTFCKVRYNITLSYRHWLLNRLRQRVFGKRNG